MRRLACLSAVVLLALTSAGCEDFRTFWHKSSLQEDMASIHDPVFPDERRIGINGMQRRDELTDPAFEAELAKIARTDPAASVRAQATRALNKARDDSARPLFMALLADTEPKVRLEAVKALRNLPDEHAIPRLIELSNDVNQNRDVRIWSVAALGLYKRVDVARTLVSLLDARDFSVAHEARMSLVRLTGRDFHFEQGTWLKYLLGRPNPFKPSPATQPS